MDWVDCMLCDEGNNRIIVYNNAAAKSNGANADYVLGQPDFVTADGSTDPPTASSLNYPRIFVIDNAANHIWVSR